MATRKKSLWKPGQSGNPKGKPKGVGEVAKLRAGIAKSVPKIIEMLTTAAERGDVQAARLLLERVLPPVKAVELAQPLKMPAGASLTDQARAVMAAAAAGELAPGQAAQLITALGSTAKIVEVDELAKRIDALEATHGKA